jgi:hypothetical protein
MYLVSCILKELKKNPASSLRAAKVVLRKVTMQSSMVIIL